MSDETTILILPGLGDSGPDHWQSHWERRDARCQRVIQTEWSAPRRDDWVACLDAAIVGVGQPVILVAHSTACALVACWAVEAAPARHIRAHGALLVAPSDPEGPSYPAGPVGFSPIPLVQLPFPSIVVSSDNDPYVAASRAREYAAAWGSRYVGLAGAGHINVASGHGEWPAGWALLQELRNAPAPDDSFPPWLSNDDTLSAFLDAFRRGTFPIAWWTHGAHVAMAACELWETPVPHALDAIRTGIRHYNICQGGQNTDSSGYHETLTRLWVGAVSAVLTTLPEGCGRLDAARHAYGVYARRSGLFSRGWYHFDVLQSTEARRAWVAPDREGASLFGAE